MSKRKRDKVDMLLVDHFFILQMRKLSLCSRLLRGGGRVQRKRNPDWGGGAIRHVGGPSTRRGAPCRAPRPRGRFSGPDTWLGESKERRCAAPPSPPGPVPCPAPLAGPAFCPACGQEGWGDKEQPGRLGGPACFPFHCRLRGAAGSCRWPICCYWHPKAPNYDD